LLNTYVVVTLFAWGIWGIFDKRALQTSTHMGVLARLYVMALWETPIIYFYLASTQPHFQIAQSVWFWTFLAALSQAIAVAAYLLAMSLTEASLVLGLTAAYPIVTQLLAVAWLHEAFSAKRAFGALAIALGVLAIAGSRRDDRHTMTSKRSLVLAVCIILATLGWGLWSILDKLAVDAGAPAQVWLAECIWELALFLAVSAGVAARGYRVELSSKNAWIFAFLSALALAVGRYTFLSALTMSSASYISTITGCYPVLMYAFCVLLLNEKFDKQRLVGISLVVAGGIVVQLTQAI
jgi:uncharacterized membrane protein